ncbi:hypothetical protein J1N35_002495 [Gossypium stocksii]|uniref:Uncharacterized protein n=1 Tax=Gossypium stocksii TaxID=47602 RepID=A0A9D4AMI4_9ROSI|nr:hypothetical protein J1N35_002495 [Gossypium stocksii]
MSSKTAESMTWHHGQRTDDGLLRHPTDSLAQKSFDNKFLSFASDPQSVRLGLVSDGFNPFKIMSISYGKMNQPSNMQTKRRSRDESDDESDEKDDPNEADL